MKQYGSRRGDNDYGCFEHPVHGEKSSRARANREPREKPQDNQEPELANPGVAGIPAHTPVWDGQISHWRCWTCDQLLIVCTKEELDYGLGGNATDHQLVAFLTRQIGS